MPQKLPIDKACWQWAETTEPQQVTWDHIRTAYRLNLPRCRLGACRRQCKGNPYCLNGIGERVWFGEIEDETWHDIQDPETERREPGTFVGLKNLGATCYVNTFLQLWFHNDTIRQGIYEWRDPSDGAETEEDWKPTSVCGHLQVIFGLLELSSRRYIDPNDFISHLGLDAGQQQDAQEFSKLFLSILEQNLLQSVGTSARNVIKEQFCGNYAYVTRCSHCNSASERMSEFYELDLTLQGHKTLEEALKGFLGIENLDGDNQYMCSYCNSKQNATRAIELKSLPPVLNLQLLRFVFEIKSGSKKKLNSCIQFPDVLDMKDYIPGEENVVYDLDAVLIHRGQSAYRGHYVAHIKGRDSQSWYKFNDEEIEKIKGRNLQLGSEEDFEPKQKKVRTPKGYHSSKNAYMLVYIRRDSGENNDGSRPSNVDAARSVMDAAEQPSSTSTSSVDPLVALSGGGEPVQSKGLVQQIGATFNDCEAKPLEIPVLKSESEKVIGSSGMVIHTSMTSKSENCIYAGMEQVSALNLSVKSDYNNVNATESVCEKMKGVDCGNVDKVENAPIRKKTNGLGANVKLPGNVLKFIANDNELFEKWISEMNEMKSRNISTGKEKQETVKSIYSDLEFTAKESCGDGYEWLPLQWLSKWLEDPNTAPAVDVTPFLCKHGKVGLEKSLKMKCVAVNGINQLFNIYGGDLRMQGDNSLCDKCVKDRCQMIQIKQKIAEDDKVISTVMKTDFSGEKCYWMGKSSYRSWRRLAVEKLDESCGEKDEESSDSTDDVQSDSNGIDNSKIDKNYVDGEIPSEEFENKPDEAKSMTNMDQDTTQKKEDVEKMVNDAEDSLQFNEDVLCEEHKGLDPDPSCRKLVPEGVWRKIRQYFPGCPEFCADSSLCCDCLSSIKAETATREMNKQFASVQRTVLADLYHDRKRPTAVSCDAGVYVVSTVFLEAWRQFLRDPQKAEKPTVMMNSVLLCKHGGYLYPNNYEKAFKSDEIVTYLRPEEWKNLRDFYPVDCEISIVCIDDGAMKEIIIIPDLCNECVARRLNDEECELYDYENKAIYIRKHEKKDKDLVVYREENDSGTDDSEFNFTVSKKRSKANGSDASELPEKMMKLNDAGKKNRKSQRHRKARGEKMVTVSSNHTLKELKLQIMKLFSVPPFDQNLYIDGKVLTDNAKTLGDLKVAPGSVVDLLADEEETDSNFLEEIHKDSGVPESGFKGTNLLST